MDNKSLIDKLEERINRFQDIVGWQPGESRNALVAEIRNAAVQCVREHLAPQSSQQYDHADGCAIRHGQGCTCKAGQPIKLQCESSGDIAKVIQAASSLGGYADSVRDMTGTIPQEWFDGLLERADKYFAAANAYYGK